MNLRVPVELLGPCVLAALDGLVPLRRQGPVVDSIPRSGPAQRPVRALGPLFPPTGQEFLAVPASILRPEPIAIQFAGGQQDMGMRLPLFPS